MGRQMWAILVKDLKAILANRQVWLPMIILPLILSVFMPSLFFVGLAKGTQKLSRLAPMLRVLPPELVFQADVQKIFYVVLNFTFPPLFLLIPLMTGSIIGASCLVGEKEHGTLETLLYTPVTLRQLFFGKLLATFVPAYLVTLLSFGVFTLVINWKGAAYLGGLTFPNEKWLILIFCISPAVILFGLSAMVIISAYASTFQGAQQLSGFVVLPFMALLIAQVSGAFALQTWHLVAGTPLLLLLDWLLMTFSLRRLTYERLLQ